MSLFLTSLVRKTSDQVGTNFNVQVLYADVANDSGSSIFCGIEYIRKLCRVNRRTAQRSTRHLELLGWLQVVGNEFGGRRPGRSKGLATVYQINPIWIEQATACLAIIKRGEHVKILHWAEGRHGVPQRAALDTSKGGTTPPQQSLTIKATNLVDYPKESSTIQKPLCELCTESAATLHLPGKKGLVCFPCWSNETGRLTVNGLY